MPPSFPCRCRRKACEHRQTKAMHPDDYARQPKCKMCGSKLRVDRYRIKRENKNPCRCWGYAFPHAKGRGWCAHNQNITDQMREFGYAGRTMTAEET